MPSGLGGGGGGQTVVNSAELPPEIRPLADQITSNSVEALARLRTLGAEPRQFPDFATVVPFAPETEQALDLTRQRALAGSPLNAANADMLQSTLRGDFLGGSQFMDAVQSDVRDLIPQINSRFAGAGRLNSGLAEATTERAIADAFASRFGQERANQLQAAGLAPQASATDFQDLIALEGVGRAREGQSGLELEDRLNRFNFLQEEERNRALELLQAAGVAPSLGQFGLNQVQSSSGGGRSGLQTALGLGLTAAGIFSGNPTLAASGASGLFGR